MDLRLSVISIVAMIALPVFSQEDSVKTAHRIAADAVPATISVSYTHLTLPTIA